MAKIKTENNKCCWGCGTTETLTYWARDYKLVHYFGTLFGSILLTLNMWLTDDAEIPLLVICPTEIHTYVHHNDTT